MNKTQTKTDATPSQKIDAYIEGMTDWRGKMLAKLRKLIHEAAPTIGEDWKWDTPVFVQHGNVVAAGAFKDHVTLNFFKGPALSDPHKLFNAGLDAKTSRRIDWYEGDKINETALKDLVRAAVTLNEAAAKKK